MTLLKRIRGYGDQYSSLKLDKHYRSLGTSRWLCLIRIEKVGYLVSFF
jgi:hypothetical protein